MNIEDKSEMHLLNKVTRESPKKRTIAFFGIKALYLFHRLDSNNAGSVQIGSLGSGCFDPILVSNVSIDGSGK